MYMRNHCVLPVAWDYIYIGYSQRADNRCALVEARMTIRHDRTSRAIVAYLAAVGEPRQAWRLIAYMRLMHGVSVSATRHALSDLYQTRRIRRVASGVYQV